MVGFWRRCVRTIGLRVGFMIMVLRKWFVASWLAGINDGAGCEKTDTKPTHNQHITDTQTTHNQHTNRPRSTHNRHPFDSLRSLKAGTTDHVEKVLSVEG